MHSGLGRSFYDWKANSKQPIVPVTGKVAGALVCEKMLEVCKPSRRIDLESSVGSCNFGL